MGLRQIANVKRRLRYTDLTARHQERSGKLAKGAALMRETTQRWIAVGKQLQRSHRDMHPPDAAASSAAALRRLLREAADLTTRGRGAIALDFSVGAGRVARRWRASCLAELGCVGVSLPLISHL